MTITIGKLHKILGEMIKNGHARKPVTIDKDTFAHNLESDGVSILPVESAKIEWIPNADGDGCVITNKDGSESGRYNLVLTGGDERIEGGE